MSDRIGNDPFSRLAQELSRNPTMIENLLSVHPPEGNCTRCRLPGAGVAIAAPCGVRVVAALALAIRAAEEARTGA